MDLKALETNVDLNSLGVQRDRAESLEASRPAERRLIWEQALDELSRLRCGLNLGGTEENHVISPAQA